MPNVLIVDDYAPFRSAVRTVLERGGFHVIGEAVDGKTALDAIQRLDPDVILLDIQLSGEDGFAISERIVAARGVSADGGPAIVLTSGRPIATYRRRLARSAAAGFIAKTDLTAVALLALLADQSEP